MLKSNIIKSITAIVIVFALVFVGCYIYCTQYQVKEIDTKTSIDGMYTIHLQQIGEPEGLFGATNGRLLLKQGNEVITNYKISVSDDGCQLGIDNWRVNWNEDSVVVTLIGGEQKDCNYTLFYDGEVEIETLSEKHEETVQETMEETPSENVSAQSQYDKDGVYNDLESQQLKKEYKAIYTYLMEKGFFEDVSYKENVALTFSYTAKGELYAIVYKEVLNDNGSDINIRRYLAYDKDLDNGKKSEIIYFEAYEREENSANNATLIKGVFEVDKETLEIWFDDRTYW